MTFNSAPSIVRHFVLLVAFDIVQFCSGYIYPGNSAYGIFVAIAVPINLPHRNVFVSYNFEANYNLPGDAQTIIPGPYQRFDSDEEDVNEAIAVTEAIAEETEIVQEEPVAKSFKDKALLKPLITRKSIYNIITNKLKTSGLNGESCILKLICEINSCMLGKSNGVIGSILHILLSPSTSIKEKISTKVYKAEENGLNGNCQRYEKECKVSIIDIISTTAESIFK